MADAPKKGEVARLTTPPPNEVVIAKSILQRGDDEFVAEDSDGVRWIVIRRDETASEAEPAWYAVNKLEPETYWMVPTDGPSRKGVMYEDGRRGMIDNGFAEFRIACHRTSGTRVASMWVQGWPCEVKTREFSMAAQHLFGGCDSFEVFRPDGSSVVP